MTPSPTQQLIGLIIDQKLELDQYKIILPPLIQKHFSVISHQGIREQRVGDLVEDIIFWERGHQTTTLEGMINEKYKIELILPIPTKANAKVVDLPDKDIARIRKETTHVAGVINREMIQLQKKFPDHFFELSFEFQRLGKNKFYKVHLKTMKDD